MKKLLFGLLAVAGLASLASAEGSGTKFKPGDYKVYRSSDVVLSTTGVRIAYSGILHKVIVSSPSYSADISTNALVTFHNARSLTNDRFKVPFSTHQFTGSLEQTYDVEFSSGIFVAVSSSVFTNAKVTAIYTDNQPSSPEKWKVWSSSSMPADTAVHRLTAGPVLLHKIIVSPKGTGTAILTVYDQYVSASPTASRRVAGIDLTDTSREYTYNILCSSGITFQSSGAGTLTPYFTVLYKRNPSSDYEMWKSSFTTGTQTTSTIFAGQGAIFGGVVNGDSVAGSFLTVYDSQGAASKAITLLDGAASFDRRMYDVQVSSGLTYTSSGAGLYSILWKRR